MKNDERLYLHGLSAALSETPGFQRIGEALGAPVKVVTGDYAVAPAVAALHAIAARPVVLLTTDSARALLLSEELQTWAGPDVQVTRFPANERLPYERRQDATEAERTHALISLARGEPGITVLSTRDALQPVAEPSAFRASLTLRSGQRIELEPFARKLIEIGYQFEPVVDMPGRASRRGGIIDVYPPGSPLPVRIELFDDEIESLREFDPATQRSQATITAVEIQPARTGADLSEAAGALLQRLDLSAMAEAEAERWEQDLAMLVDRRRFDGDDYYAQFLVSASALDHLHPDTLLVVETPDVVRAKAEGIHREMEEARNGHLADRGVPAGLPVIALNRSDLDQRLKREARVEIERFAPENAGNWIVLPFAPAPSFAGKFRRVLSDAWMMSAQGRHVVIASQQAVRLAELMTEEGRPTASHTRIDDPTTSPGVDVVQGALHAGWSYGSDLTVISDAEIFGFRKQRRPMGRRQNSRAAFLSELQKGDYVVHIDHGIARFNGLVHRQLDEVEREYLELAYAEGDRIYVPVAQVDRVSRYVGGSENAPHLTRLGTQEWQRAKARVRKAVAEMAKELLQLYAMREVIPGHAFQPDGSWQMEMEAAFPFVETPDQLEAIRQVKEDMERQRPMDRLLVGDVGFGKTEVAIRAAFKAACEGYQVAVLVPTTVLAQQHHGTFAERIASFPVTVEMLSRFRSDKEQKEIIQRLQDGSIDILVGTHRLLGKDVDFKNLGLIVIDEEQRFGVAHKERLKRMRAEVDVLTMSATPIPRTLHMSLAGVRDMSSIETAPEERLPIKTYVMEWDDHIIREAILRELDRGGQVYFVHNRVHNIASVAYKIGQLIPEAEVRIGHGQMPEEELERVMIDFARGDADVLVCTTIIESGLDIPNVNTIIMNQANTLGLSQLYQLRGRVGRGAHQAYAYLLYDKSRALSETAQKRLQAVFEANELGAGFQIALRDLEIRGAGNLLGAEQSGHIAAVGFDLYNQMLADAVEKLKRAWKPEEAPAERRSLPPVDLPITAHVPEAYIPDLNLRLAVYERISQLDNLQALTEYSAELEDRFGEPPPALNALLFQTRLRILAVDAGLQSISTEEDKTIVLRFPDEGGAPAQAWNHLRSRTVEVRRTQIRIDLEAAGEGWTQVLESILTQLSAGEPVEENWTHALPAPPARTETPVEEALDAEPAPREPDEVRLPRRHKWTERRITR